VKTFERLFEPRSLAVVGVSEDAARPGSQTVEALLRNGYQGRIYPVNPRYPTFQGLQCYACLSDIPDEVDVAVIGVPARAAVEVIEDCARKQVPYAVVLSGGFRESGADGVSRQAHMVEIARRAGMRIIGPNCLGLANIHKDVYAAFGSITRAPKLRKGAVSLVTQSGGFGYSIALACARAAIGFRNVVATGNEADVHTVEIIDALLEDDATNIIIAYIEGLASGRALLEVGKRALARGKPLLVWKGGVTEQGAKAAATHTANLTGSYDFYRAVFKQAGIIEINEIHEAVDLVKAFESRKLPHGRRVAVMGGSGGSAIVFADAAENAGLTLSTFSEQTKQALSKVVPEIGSVVNPVDFTAGYIGGKADNFETAVQAVLNDSQVDAVCLNFATIAGAQCHAGAQVLSALTERIRKPLFVFLSTPPSETGNGLFLLEEAKIPVLGSPVRVARAMAALATYREARERLDLHSIAAQDAVVPTVPAVRGALSEVASKRILESAGIAVTRDRLVQSAAEARFGELVPPLAVKIVSPDIAHKTEVGGVVLHVNTSAELERAVEAVLDNARSLAPGARIEGVMISEMLTEGFELLAGAVNDAVFGPVVVVGAGGIHAELLRDTTCRLAPFNELTACEMLDELRCRPILDGARGKPALDVAAAARAIAALSALAWHNRDSFTEIDVNPLFVLPNAAVAADALIVGREPPADDTG
jgi:acyl-CoA synthetase (NDP forming)